MSKVLRMLTRFNLVLSKRSACAKTWTGLWTVDYGLWTMDRGLWTVDYGPWTMDCGLWTVDCFLGEPGGLDINS